MLLYGISLIRGKSTNSFGISNWLLFFFLLFNFNCSSSMCNRQLCSVMIPTPHLCTGIALSKEKKNIKRYIKHYQYENEYECKLLHIKM